MKIIKDILVPLPFIMIGFVFMSLYAAFIGERETETN
jgi:hypothetical protein